MYRWYCHLRRARSEMKGITRIQRLPRVQMRLPMHAGPELQRALRSKAQYNWTEKQKSFLFRSLKPVTPRLCIIPSIAS